MTIVGRGKTMVKCGFKNRGRGIHNVQLLMYSTNCIETVLGWG